MSITLRFTWVFFVLFAGLSTVGQPDRHQVHVFESLIEKSIEINAHLQIFSPEDENISISTILSDSEISFSPYEDYELEGVVWGKIGFFNGMNRDLDIILRLTQNFGGGELTVYIVRDNKVVDAKKSGHFLSSVKKDIEFQHDPHISTMLPRKEKTVLYIKNEPVSGYPTSFDLKLYSLQSWQNQIQNDYIFQAAFHGILWMLFIYNFIISLQSYNRTFFLYSLYLLFFSLFSATIYNHIGVLIQLDHKPLFFVIFGAFSIGFYLLFLQRFIDVKDFGYKWRKNIKRFNSVVFSISALGILSAVVFIDDILIADWAMRILSITMILPVLFLSFFAIVKKSKVAKYVAFGAIFLLSGMLMAILKVIFFEDQTSVYGQVGILGEILIFSLGLGYKMKLNEEEKHIAQVNLIKQLRRNQHMHQQWNGELEDLVRRRTKEVSIQKKEVESKALLLEAQNNELNRVNSFKDRLFAIIGHDLRNPIKSLKGVLEMHSKGYLSEEQLDKFTSDLNKSLSRIISLLDNVLMWALQQMDHIDYKPAKIKLKELVIENIELLMPQIKQKELKIESKVGPNLNVFVDSEMIKLVIRNILSNAIKFSNKGDSIDVIARKDNGMVYLSISDSGIGIPEDGLNKLFNNEVYSTYGTNHEKGTGLGLQLCYDFIKKNHGDISVESEFGNGSTFTIQLPEMEIERAAMYA